MVPDECWACAELHRRRAATHHYERKVGSSHIWIGLCAEHKDFFVSRPRPRPDFDPRIDYPERFQT
jgi:hypothetical protein